MLRWLLLAAAGGGSFHPVPAPDTFELVAAPGAAWPRGQAFYYAGHSYIASGNDAGGYRIIVFRHSDGTVFNRLLTADGVDPVDVHNSPGICRRESDNRLFTVRGDHSGPNVYVRVSTDSLDTDPTLANGFGTQTNLNAQLGATNYTYMYPMDLSGTIWMFYRDQDGSGDKWAVTSSADAGDSGDDGGTGWSTGVHLFGDGDNASGRVSRSSATRFDVVCNDDASNLYHFYYDGTYRDSDGTSIGSPPFAFGDFTEIWNATTEGTGAGGFSVQKVGSEIGITFETSDNGYHYAFWDGSWDHHLIVASVGTGGTAALNNGMCFVDPADLSRVVVSRRPGSDPFAIYRYTTADDGVSWSSTLLYADASNHTIYPTYVQGHTAGLEWVALTGYLTTESDFSFALLGYG